MRETYQADITPKDLEETLTEYLCGPSRNLGFRRGYLEELHPSDRIELERRDRREIVGSEPHSNGEWRSDDEYLLYTHPAGNVAYIRTEQVAPRMTLAIPFDVHLMTPAPDKFQAFQYFTLAIGQKPLKLLKERLHERGFELVNFISDMDGLSLFSKIPTTIAHVSDSELPIHTFHSLFVSIARGYDKIGKEPGRQRAIETLSTAIGSAIIAAKIFSEKQIEYYRATAGLGSDSIFIESAII